MDTPAEKNAEKNEAAPRRREWRKQLLYGLMLGTLAGFEVSELGLSGLVHCEHPLLLLGATGAILALTRARKGFTLCVGALSLAVLVIGYTPLILVLLPPLVRKDA